MLTIVFGGLAVIAISRMALDPASPFFNGFTFIGLLLLGLYALETFLGFTIL